MSNSEVDQITRETLEKGGILAKLYFDMQSEKQDDLQPIMADLINNRLLKIKGVVYCYGSIDEPIKIDSVYTTNAEVTALFIGIGPMITVIFNFVPAGIEIIKPERELRLKINELQSLMLEMSQISLDYSKYILEKVMTKEDYAKVMEHMRNREDIGRKLLEKKDEK
jgi:hypothetical protein